MKLLYKIGVFLGILKKRHMPPPVRTIDQIIAELNADGGTWTRMPGFFVLTSPIIPPQGIGNNLIDFTRPTNGMVLVAFVNLQNAEVRTFIAKYLAIPERGV